MVERGPEKAGVGSSILPPGTIQEKLMDYYEKLFLALRNLNPGTRHFINLLFNREKVSFLKECISILKKVNEKESEVQKLSQKQMREKTEEFKKRLMDGESLDDILVESFALVREAARRTLNMRHFDVQIIGGYVLHKGKVAEMATGEGKTLVAVLPLYLNALEGKGCHLVTVNDYLAKRDTQWMGPIYHYLGLSVGCIVSYKELKGKYSSTAYIFDPTYLPADSRFLYLRPISRKEAYMCDITYGVGSEFGFDYLRDNMALRKEDQVQRELNYAIIDEVDSILIDEARTPLIISGPSEESTSLYYEVDRLVRKLVRDKDFTVDEENQTVSLTEEGVKKCERLLGINNLYDGTHTELIHHINQALRAHCFFKRDKEYVVKNGKVIIVDEFTGRLMPGRRWSDGLHQAIEAKEGLRIESENQTLATISFQNYFKLYKKIAGMTGTAITEAAEFKEIYGLDVIVIPTNKPLRRKEYDDEIYKTEREKFNAVVAEVEKMYKIGRPVLVGTISIEKAEKLSRLLRQKNIPHQVLHGKNHEAEAAIIAQAGRPKAVTIATQMAGRGVDIILGGNPEILAREETVKVIWSRKKTKKGKNERYKGKELREILQEIEDNYNKRLQQIDSIYKGRIENLKKELNEREREFSQIDEKVKEEIEKELFEKKGGENYRKFEERLKKLKERYLSANENYQKLAEKYKNQPERTKEAGEILNKAYRDFVLFKEKIMKTFNISTSEYIEEKRRQILSDFESKRFAPKEVVPKIEEYIGIIKNYKDSYSIIASEKIKEGKNFKILCEKINDYENFIKGLKEILNTGKFEEIERYIEKENTIYEKLAKSIKSFEREIILEKGGSVYIEAEKKYKEVLKEYENLSAEYEKNLSKERKKYEKERGKIEKEWARAREELEKSPEEFKEVYEQLLEKYKKPWLVDHKKVVELGGLHIIGTERHESRRIDNQLKGRAGRQGDPGSSKFFLSLEDDLLRIFGSERLMGIMSHLPEGEKITHPLITRLINNAQKKVEARNFEIRKQLLEFDNVLNEQRKVIYSLRQDILEGKGIEDYIYEFIEEFTEEIFDEFFNLKIKPDFWNIDGFKNYVKNTFGFEIEFKLPDKPALIPSWREDFKSDFMKRLKEMYNKKKEEIGDFFNEIQKVILLQVIDNRWKSHLRALDELREGIGLRVYAQRDPLIAYKHEGYQMFQQMLSSIRKEVLSYLFRIEISPEPVPVKVSPVKKSFVHQQYSQFPSSEKQQPVKKKIGRNDPCPCGSGKKYKHCCGKNV